MPARGGTLRSQSQQLILNLLEYFEREKQNDGPLLPLSSVQKRVADALKISLFSVKRIKNRSVQNTVLSSPGKTRHRRKTKTEDLPEGIKMNIRNTLYNMYSQSKFPIIVCERHVTVTLLNNELRENQITLGNSSLNRAFHLLGFDFRKDSNRRALMEKPYIADMRLQHLRNYMQNLNSPNPKPVVFLDET
ncbi:transposable element-related [Holotrichia oblita]|uniref:Transposable element-related n=1 Tax=Holotrichia oblita TaxID=644536 RepID=A0ACB9SN89_HOLOL|nr:transposable element-related [Holotrichia oblita]